MRRLFQIASAAFMLALVTGCGPEAAMKRTVHEVGEDTLRAEALAACREGFKAGVAQKVPEESWPPSVRAFKPMALWAEPDGAYILLDSDADGERGVYIPRIPSDTDPVCGPKLTHTRLGKAVHSYDRKR